MFPEILFEFVLEQLADEITARPAPVPNPLNTDTWIARSVMQKAIRRGMTDLALRAAATLIVTDRRTLWRRLLTTALEDLGPKEIDTTARIVAAMKNPEWRAKVGGEWAVIAELVVRSCEGARCQSANDLRTIALHAPELVPVKSDLCEANFRDLITTAINEDCDVTERAVAVMLATGQDCGPEAPVHIRPDPSALFEAFEGAGRFGHVVAVYAQAFRATGLGLAPLALCLWRESADTPDVSIADDPLPSVGWIDDIPTFALDQYVRCGKSAIHAFVRHSSDWRAFANDIGLTRANWSEAAGELVFQVEGAVVTSRRLWTLGSRLHERASTLGCFIPEEAVPEGKLLILRQLPLIDQMRRETKPT